jgi:hypothetical protein
VSCDQANEPSLGEIVDTGILVNTRKIFDETIDSGISESSVTSEVPKASASGITPVKVKQERESSDDSDSPPENKPKKSRKRQPSTDSDSDSPPVTKKIKIEPMEALKEEDLIPPPQIKVEKTSDSEDSSIRSAKIHLTAKDSKTDKKAKKKKKREEPDDFETSLQNLLNSAIKSKH